MYARCEATTVTVVVKANVDRCCVGIPSGRSARKSGSASSLLSLITAALSLNEATQRRREEKIEEAKKKKGNALQTLRRKMKEVVRGNKW